MMAHYALVNLAWASGGAFVGAYLLRLGFSLPEAILSYAGIMGLRFFARFAGVEAVRRLGCRNGLALGTALCALEFPLLLWADSPWGMAAWILLTSVAESIYWPLFHAVTAVVCSDASRGRELGLRQSVTALIGVAGPMAGGLAMAHLGAAAVFGASAAMCLAGIGPILLMRGVSVGAIPTMRQALGLGDRLSAIVFASDGWLTSGYLTAWGLVLFSTLDADYESFGWAAAAAALVSAGLSLACGKALDRGGRQRYLRLASAATVGSLLFRALSSGSPTLSVIANVSGAVMAALYTPVVMSVVYARAKSSGRPYGFHLAMEAAWDAGFVAGCLVAAAVAAWSPIPSLCVLPSLAGIIIVHMAISGTRLPMAKAVDAVPA